MLRKNKNVVIYQGGRAIGGAGTHAFKREEATRLLVNRTIAKPDAVKETPETAQIDALAEQAAEQAAEKRAEAVVRKVRSIDIRSKANRIRGGQWRDIW
jgi:hypothetical protein